MDTGTGDVTYKMTQDTQTGAPRRIARLVVRERDAVTLREFAYGSKSVRIEDVQAILRRALA